MTSETDKHSVILGLAKKDELDYLDANDPARLRQMLTISIHRSFWLNKLPSYLCITTDVYGEYFLKWILLTPTFWITWF